MYIPKHLKFVKLKDKGRALLANRDIKKGEVILKMKGFMNSSKDSSYESVQIDKDTFIDSENYYVDDFINHSCNPNLWLNIINMNYITLRNIKKGEEITINYMTNEYDLVEEDCYFKCKCGSKSCLKHIKGFKYLTKKQKEKLKPFLSPFLKKKLLNNKLKIKKKK